ncbi:MAG: Hsp20/alpha crystallin family protein [Pyrinomonadaceae bacterium]
MAQWNPLHDLVTLQDRMNRLFEDASQRRATEAKPSDEVEGADWYPAADVYENDAEYTVTVDLPGIDRATLDISVDDNRLTITGNRAGQDMTRHRAECPRGKFFRTFSVPASVDQNDIRAEYKDGVLQVHLPKRRERKVQRVEIKVS